MELAQRCVTDTQMISIFKAFGNYDHLEYAGIWAITLVMTIWGMTAALIAVVFPARAACTAGVVIAQQCG